MKFSFQWLKEYVDFPHTPSELADALTHLGLEVEGVTEQGADFKGWWWGNSFRSGPSRRATISRFARSPTERRPSPLFAAPPT